MNTTLITDPERIAWIYDTYMKHDFPRNELKPLVAIRKARERGRYDCYEMTDESGLIGYAFFVKLPAGGKFSAGGKFPAGDKLPAGDKFHYLVDYLAITPEQRGQGCGSLLLRQLSELITDADCMTVEVEDPDWAEDEAAAETRRRRLKFYQDNGYVWTDVTGLVFGVHYRILEMPCGTSHTTEELREIYFSFYKSMISPAMYEAFVKMT